LINALRQVWGVTLWEKLQTKFISDVMPMKTVYKLYSDTCYGPDPKSLETFLELLRHTPKPKPK